MMPGHRCHQRAETNADGGFLGNPTTHYGNTLPWSLPDGLWQGWGAVTQTSAFRSAVSAFRYPSIPSTNPCDSANNTCKKTLQRGLGRNTPIGMFPLSLPSQDFCWSAGNNSSNKTLPDLPVKGSGEQEGEGWTQTGGDKEENEVRGEDNL